LLEAEDFGPESMRFVEVPDVEYDVVQADRGDGFAGG
jgi:hypothetical protein